MAENSLTLSLFSGAIGLTFPAAWLHKMNVAESFQELGGRLRIKFANGRGFEISPPDHAVTPGVVEELTPQEVAVAPWRAAWEVSGLDNLHTLYFGGQFHDLENL